MQMVHAAMYVYLEWNDHLLAIADKVIKVEHVDFRAICSMCVLSPSASARDCKVGAGAVILLYFQLMYSLCYFRLSLPLLVLSILSPLHLLSQMFKLSILSVLYVLCVLFVFYALPTLSVLSDSSLYSLCFL